VPVEQSAGVSPGLQPESHPVRQPEVIEIQVRREPAELRPEERTERSPRRNPFGERGVGAGVGVQHGVAGDEALLEQRIGLGDLPVPPVLEVGKRELRAVVEGRADADLLAVLESAFPDDPGQLPDPLIGARRGVRAVFPRGEVDVALRRGGGDEAGRVGDSVPAGPLEAVFGVAGVFEDLAAVGEPEQHGNPVGNPDQPLPLMEHLPADRAQFGFGIVHERLGAQFQRHISQHHSPPIDYA